MEISVTKPDGSPLVGAEVGSWPNQSMDQGGAQLLGGCFPTLEMIETWIAGEEWDLMSRLRSQQSRYVQTTDKNGKCVIPDLPLDRRLGLHVEHDEFQIKSQGNKNLDRHLTFRLTEQEANKKLKIEVEPIPK